MTRLLVAGLALLGSISLASAQLQQPVDPAVLSRAISVLEQQRNIALNAQVNTETRAIGLAEENEKLKARVKELEKAAQPKADAPPAEAAKKE